MDGQLPFDLLCAYTAPPLPSANPFGVYRD